MTDNTLNINLKKKAAIISLLIGLAMFAAKMGAYLVTGSAAIFSDAAESVVHVLATAMALYSILLSAKPADDSHPYGHSNIEYFSVGIEGLLIVGAALFIIFEAVKDLIEGTQLQSLSTGVIIISIAGAVNLGLGIYLIKMGKKTDSLTLIADGKHVLTDSYTSIGVLIGIILVIFTGFTPLDPIFAIGVATNILVTGYKLVRESIGGLMHEVDPEIMQKLVDTLNKMKKDFWIDIHELRYWQSGNRIFIDFHLIIPYYFTIQQSHIEEKRIEEGLEKTFPLSQIKIHFDYCKPDVCKYCKYSICKVRSEKFSINFKWNVEKLSGKAIYLQESN